MLGGFQEPGDSSLLAVNFAIAGKGSPRGKHLVRILKGAYELEPWKVMALKGKTTS